MATHWELFQAWELLPLAGRPLGQVLLDADTELASLREIKEHWKKLTVGDGTLADRASATTIYFAAIASALVCHGEKITTHCDEALEDSFGTLAAKRWMPEELVRLFEKARDLCRARPGTAEQTGSAPEASDA